jgi:hypothetical protein
MVLTGWGHFACVALTYVALAAGAFRSYDSLPPGCAKNIAGAFLVVGVFVPIVWVAPVIIRATYNNKRC